MRENFFDRSFIVIMKEENFSKLLIVMVQISHNIGLHPLSFIIPQRER